MSAVRDKAQAFTKQLVGQMVGDDLLVQEGKEQERKAAGEPSKADPPSKAREKENKRDIKRSQQPPRPARTKQ